ncbi:galactoside permease [compost metagenome]
MLYVGNVVVSSPAGYLYDRIGFDKTYIIMGAIALVFTLISTLTLSACQTGTKTRVNNSVKEAHQ